MGEYVRLTAPDGGIVHHVQPVGRWPWAVLLLGVVIVAIGGLLFSPDEDIHPAVPTTTSITGQAVP